jgi:hypothetical protein
VATEAARDGFFMLFTKLGMRDVYILLVGRHERKREFGKLRHKWKDNIKVVLKEMWCNSGD